MVGRRAANWSPYDFTPITLSRPPKKRPRPESPQFYQAPNVIPSDTDSPPRTQAIAGPLPDAEDNERAVQASSATKNSYRGGQSQFVDATRSISPDPSCARATGRVPGIGDILGSFKQPEAHTTFKEEPVDEDIMRLPLRRPASARKRNEKTRSGTPATTKLTIASARRQQQKRTNGNREQGNEGTDSGRDKEQHVIVDLTTEDEIGPQTQTQTQSRDTGTTVRHQYGIPSYQTLALSQRSDHDEIPEIALQQVREQYAQEHIILPTYVKTWYQLGDFAGRNQNQSRVTPAFLSQIRDFYVPLGLTPHGKDSTNAQLSSLGQGTSQDWENRGPFPHNNGSYMFDPQHPWSSNAHGPFPTISTAAELRVKLEHEMQSKTIASTQRPLRGPVHRDSVYGGLLRPGDQDQRRVLGSLPHHHNSGQSTSQNFQPLSAEIIGVLTQPSDDLLNLLPSTAPPGHPHLVSLWNPDLLRLPTNQHDHLNLIDTVASIIAKYDMKDQSTIKAFLDINDCPHFFYLFKSRTSAWHSWSIEREWDIVTIGLERNNRASNTAESTRPSSGQFDVTVIFKMDPFTPVNATLPAATNSNPNASAVPATNALPTSLPSTNDSLSASQAPPLPTTENPQTTPSTRLQPTIPGKWNLCGTTIFPAQPSLPTFLWSTPPNRGADDVSRYHHPTQTSLLPPPHLSMLARYLQHTAFTCTAMEAEFQVAWGRKVRYDAQLGRVRPTWDYALKGAKTQKEKRKRGDYNVVPVVEKKSGGNGGGGKSVTQTTNDDGNSRGGDTTKKVSREERPGAGDTLDWLAGRDGVEDVKTTSTEERGATLQGREKGGKGRKRPKREEGDGSGSEYMDSSEEE